MILYEPVKVPSGTHIHVSEDFIRKMLESDRFKEHLQQVKERAYRISMYRKGIIGRIILAFRRLTHDKI